MQRLAVGPGSFAVRLVKKHLQAQCLCPGCLLLLFLFLDFVLKFEFFLQTCHVLVMSKLLLLSFLFKSRIPSHLIEGKRPGNECTDNGTTQANQRSENGGIDTPCSLNSSCLRRGSCRG